MSKFELNEKEEEKAKAFIEKHSESCAIYNSAGFKVGPLYSYTFTPTGIGTAAKIKCTGCGEEEDITDMSCW
jgi:hypothetical protein